MPRLLVVVAKYRPDDVKTLVLVAARTIRRQLAAHLLQRQALDDDASRASERR